MSSNQKSNYHYKLDYNHIHFVVNQTVLCAFLYICTPYYSKRKVVLKHTTVHSLLYRVFFVILSGTIPICRE